MRNGGWLYLDNHLEKLLEGIFQSKSLFSNNGERYRESLGVALTHDLSLQWVHEQTVKQKEEPGMEYESNQCCSGVKYSV
jgi:hypothetical protein